jgi:excisionase family DNA binding protein
MISGEWLRIPGAAELVGYTAEWIRQLARAGRIRTIKAGREWLIHEVDLLEYYAAMKSRSKAGEGRASVRPPSPTQGERSNRATEQEPITTIPDGWLTTREAAELTGYSRAWVRQLARAGRTRAAKIEGEWVMHKDDLLARRVHRQVYCLWCGKKLEHRSTGRPKKFCSAKCRVYYGRAKKQHARTSAEDAL